ncbi:MAG: 30S ribosomal protein S15 [Nanoarchaeota archaeon]
MARMHAGKKGKSGSRRPVKADLSLVTIKPKEVEKIILDMAKDATKPSQIGLVLRDTYAVPNVKALTGKSVSQIIREAKLGLEVPEDLQNLVSKALALKKHLQNNKKDLHNKRGLILIESKIRRLVKYYKNNSRIPANWSYN